MWTGIAFGVVLLLVRDFFGFWYIAIGVNVFIAITAYMYTYYAFYKEFKNAFPGVNLGFFNYVNLKASHGKVSIQEVSAEDTLKEVARDIFTSEQVKEMTKSLYDNTEEGAFWGWGAMIINGLFFTSFTAGVAAQNSLGTFFASWLGAIMGDSDIKVLVWAFIIIGGLVLVGKIFGLDKK